MYKTTSHTIVHNEFGLTTHMPPPCTSRTVALIITMASVVFAMLAVTMAVKQIINNDRGIHRPHPDTSATREGFYSWDVNYLNKEGDYNMDDSCAVDASGNTKYVMHGNTYLQRHPTDPNTCMLRNGLREPAIMDDRLAMCSSGQVPLQSHGVVSSMRTEAVEGRERCVLRMQTGKDQGTYRDYERGTRVALIKLTTKYLELKRMYDILLAQYEEVMRQTRQAENDLADLNTQFEGHKKQRDESRAAAQEGRQKLQQLQTQVAAVKSNASSLMSQRANEQQAARDHDQRLRNLASQLNISHNSMLQADESAQAARHAAEQAAQQRAAQHANQQNAAVQARERALAELASQRRAAEQAEQRRIAEQAAAARQQQYGQNTRANNWSKIGNGPIIAADIGLGLQVYAVPANGVDNVDTRIVYRRPGQSPTYHDGELFTYYRFVHANVHWGGRVWKGYIVSSAWTKGHLDYPIIARVMGRDYVSSEQFAIYNAYYPIQVR
jgi:hypothetical protein